MSVLSVTTTARPPGRNKACTARRTAGGSSTCSIVAMSRPGRSSGAEARSPAQSPGEGSGRAPARRSPPIHWHRRLRAPRWKSRTPAAVPGGSHRRTRRPGSALPAGGSDTTAGASALRASGEPGGTGRIARWRSRRRGSPVDTPGPARTLPAAASDTPARSHGSAWPETGRGSTGYSKSSPTATGMASSSVQMQQRAGSSRSGSDRLERSRSEPRMSCPSGSVAWITR